jgi:iron complex outermembrane receptor protein
MTTCKTAVSFQGFSGLRAAAVLCGLLALGGVDPRDALAQQTAAASAPADDSIGEVVVTARRVSEKIQDIPLSITSVSSETIEKVGATNLRDILDQVPGVVLQGTASEALENPVIRGEYDFNFSAFTDGQPNVAVFLDGVYLQNNQAISLALMNIDRVEVIEGPVSALYGRTGFAGAINYVDKLPTDEFHADVLARFEQYQQYQYQGGVSGPIVPGLLKAGFYYNYDYSRGDYQDHTNGNWIGGHNKNDMKFIVDFTPTDKLDITGGVYYGSDHFSQDPLVVAANNYSCAGAVFNLQCGAFVASNIQVASIPAQAGDSGNNRIVTLSHLKVNYDLDFADATYLAGFNNVIQRSYEDFVAQDTGLIFPLTNATTGALTGTTADAFELFGDDDTTQDWSQELRLTSKQNQPLRWSFGADFFHSHLETTTLAGIGGQNIPAGDSINSAGNFFLAQQFVTPYGGPSPTLVTLTELGDKQYSAFGSLEYDPISQVTVGAEYRYTRDEQVENIIYNNFQGGTAHPEPFGPIAPDHFDYGNYRAYLKYKFTPDVLAYVSVATGTKPGGFNTQSSLKSNQTYDPEKNTTYEFGVKSTFLDHKVQVNADVYHIDSKGIQLYFPEGDGLHSVIENIGGTSNTGAELAVKVVPITHLQLGLALAYTDPKFTSGSYDTSNVAYCTYFPSCAPLITQLKGGSGVNVKGFDLPDVSKITANLSADYSYPIVPGIDGFVHADYRYESKQYTSLDLFNTSWVPETYIANLKIGATRGQFTADLFVKNLFNDEAPLDVARNTEFTNFSGNYEFVASLYPPRVWGGEIAYHF